MKEGTDFKITTIHGLFHWEGLGDYSHYCSEDGFVLPSEAAADGIAFLQSLDDDTDTEADFSDLCA